MKNNTKMMMAVTTGICLLPMVMGVLLYSQLPDQIPVHFNAQGDADGYASKFLACFGLPMMMAAINAAVHFFMEADPRKQNQSPRLKRISMWLVPVISMIVVPMSLLISLGKDIPVQIVIPVLVGLLIILCGNYLPKSRQNYTIGIKLPWTLTSEDNWNKTHRLAGFLWMIAGGLMIVLTFAGVVNTAVLMSIIGVIVLFPIIYSYLIYRKDI